ncbi:MULTISPECIES: hypothetical protein [unclassified Streptomyces]|jgi:hypothetical protein|uniref:hypothetical protein n=1 Tax=unclassified Streptomyces TaxID=2593676 RepID=UPI0037F6987B
MTALDADAWANALTMYERRYSIVTVGPRTHQDWSQDALALLRKEVSDPRSWRTLEYWSEADEEWRADWLAPFEEPGPDWPTGLWTVPRTSVERLLVMLSTNWLDVPNERKRNDFEARRPELERKARVILSRFPEETSFYTNSGYPGSYSGPSTDADVPDFYEATTGCTPLSQHDWDLGLFAVSETEVGIFWSFDAT